MAKKSASRKNNSRAHQTAHRAPPKPIVKTPILLILRDQGATTKLLEAVLDASNGKRMLSRFARTCKAFCGPTLDILWRELDSLVPIIGLFPNNIMKKARKPGFGLVSGFVACWYTMLDMTRPDQSATERRLDYRHQI
jgi:hypothetical protein